MNIGQRIKERRKAIGLTVDEVAKKLSKNRATVYRYESNDIENLPISILEPLAQILQTTPSYLMGWEDNELNSVQNKDFYSILLKIMKNKNLSIPDIAKATGLSDSTLRSIISRKTKNISLEVAFKLSKGLNISLEELNGDKEISSINSYNNYSEEEQQHIEDLRKLNTEGKNKVINYTKDLIEMPKYQKDSNITSLPKREKQIWEEPGKEYLMPIASHDREGNFTEEEYKHDDELMNNEDIWK